MFLSIQIRSGQSEHFRIAGLALEDEDEDLALFYIYSIAPHTLYIPLHCCIGMCDSDVHCISEITVL